MKIWGLGLFLTLLLFTTVFSQEQSDAAGASSVVIEAAVDAAEERPSTAAVGDPAAEQPASPGAGNASGATLSQTQNRPSNIPELTAYIRKSLKEHPILTNLCLLGGLIVIVHPDLDKTVLFPQGYIAAKSGHSRGSTVDLTLFDMRTEKEVDMGGTFDWFGPESHPDWGGNPETQQFTGNFPADTPAERKINEFQFRNRMLLRSVMLKHGFKPVDTEWWHFTLSDEPYPDTYFDYQVR